MPKIKIMIFAGRSILCVIKLSSINGDDALLSIKTNNANDPADNNPNEMTIICVGYTLLPLLLVFPMYVRVSRNEAIVTAKVIAPFASSLGLLPLLLLLLVPTRRSGFGKCTLLDLI